MSATVHDTADGGKVAVLKCETCSTKLRGFTAADEVAARVIAEMEARGARWQVTPAAPARPMAWGTAAEVPAKYHCPRHHPRKP